MTGGRAPGARALAAAHRPLVRALRRRALPPARLALTLPLALALAAALGRYLAAHGLLAPLTPFLVVPFAAAVAYRVADHVAADHEAGWLGPLVAAAPAGAPAAYALAVVALAAAAAIAHEGAAALGLALGAATAGGAGAASGGATGALAAALHSAARLLPGAAALTLAVAAYAGVCALLCRRRGPALALAALGIGAPLAIVGWWQGGGSAPPPLATRLLGLHLPVLAWRPEPALLARQALYAAAALAVVAWLAPRTVARER